MDKHIIEILHKNDEGFTEEVEQLFLNPEDLKNIKIEMEE